MKKTSPTINLEALQKPKPPEKKEKKKRKNIFKLFKKEKNDPGTRNLRFARRPIKKWITIFLYGFIITSFLVLLMTFGRLQTLTEYAYKKDITKEQLAQQVNNDSIVNQQVIYEGNQFLTTFFTVDKEEEALKQRSEKLATYLATDLSLDSIENISIEMTRTIKDIQLVKSIPKEKDRYTLTYDVVFSEKEQTYQAQVQLTASFKEQQWKLVNIPMFLNIEPIIGDKGNKDTYNPSDFYVKGEEVDQTEQVKIKDFVDKFFKLYVKDDENLKLISTVRGLKEAELEQLDIKSMTINKNGMISVEGTYTIHYQKGSSFTSFFSLSLEKNKDSFFVKKIGNN